MATKVKASAEGIQEIDQKRRDKEWTKDQNSEVLIIASQQQFKKSIAEHLDITEEKAKIPIKKLDSLIAKEKIFTDRSYIKVRQHFTKLENENIDKITIEQCLKLIEDDEIRSNCITYRNWQDFLNGKEIYINIFQAFCEALEIEDWRSCVTYPRIYQKTNTNHTCLVAGLSLFNHRTQVKLLLEKFYEPSRIFLINNSCLYSQTWMVRRLVMKITEYSPHNCLPVCLDNSTRLSSSSDDENIKKLFEEKNFAKFIKVLDSNHLIFTLDVNNYDKNRIKNFLNQDWNPLEEYVRNLPAKRRGKVFMFLLLTNQNNDWCQSEGIKDDLFPKILNLPHNDIYQTEQEGNLKDEITQVLLEINARLNKEQLSNQPENIAIELINKINNQQNKAESLLKVIYQHFNCPTTEFAKIWQTYP